MRLRVSLGSERSMMGVSKSESGLGTENMSLKTGDTWLSRLLRTRNWTPSDERRTMSGSGSFGLDIGVRDNVWRGPAAQAPTSPSAPNLAVHRHRFISYVGRRAVSDIALELWCDITFRKSNVHIANILLKLQSPAHLRNLRSCSWLISSTSSRETSVDVRIRIPRHDYVYCEPSRWTGQSYLHLKNILKIQI